MTAFPTVPCKLCGKPIVWGASPDGKRIPLDPRAPVYRISFVVGGPNLAERVREDPPGRIASMVSHFATCPNVGALNRGGRAE